MGCCTYFGFKLTRDALVRKECQTSGPDRAVERVRNSRRWPRGSGVGRSPLARVEVQRVAASSH
ncbi:hypothetical protein BJV78DRAFT_1164824 [Lactifluus subvellereus]|nr:hypothetical protein BJV78DRAFT_1164824 [Lactifluus subvellereus]